MIARVRRSARAWLRRAARDPLRAVGGTAAVALMLWACGTPAEPEGRVLGARLVRLALDARVAAQQTDDLNVLARGFYQRGDQSRQDLGEVVQPLTAEPQQAVPVRLDIGPCLADPQRAPAGPTCPLFIELLLRRGATILDRIILGPISVSPGQTVTPPGGPIQLAELAAVVVEPAEATLLVGGTQQLTATVFAQNDQTVQRAVEWRSSATTVATVSPSGLVTAVGNGTATISATAFNRVGLATITVSSSPAIAVTPATVTFSDTVGGANPAAQQVAVTNAGGGTLESLVATVTYGPQQPTGWLTATLSQTTAPATLTLAAATGQLPVGQYTAQVAIDGTASNTPRTVAVTFNVAAPPSEPAIALSAATAAFTGAQGQVPVSPATATITVTNGGTGGAGALTGLAATVTFAQGQPGGWLAATLNQTTSPATLTLTPTTGTLTAGTYSATVTVTAPVATNSPQPVAVTFTVQSNPAVVLASDSVPFTAVAFGASPAAQQVGVTNGGAGGAAGLTGLAAQVVYDAAPPEPWLTATVAPATSPAQLTLQPVTGALPAGTYLARVIVTSTAAGAIADTVRVSFQVTPQPTMLLTVARLGDVSVGRSNTLTVTLGQPAPSGGLEVQLVAQTGGIIGIESDGIVEIPAGGTSGTATINGFAAGTTVVEATAPGYVTATRPVTAVVRTLGIPATQRVPFTQTAQMPANVTPAVPAGRSAPLTITTSAPGFVGINPTPGSVIALGPGQNTANFVLDGVLPGESTVIVSNPDYGADTVIAVTRAIVDFLPTSVNIPATFTLPVRVDFRASAGGTVIAAPTGGISVTFVSRNPACVAVPPPQTIPAGQVSINPDPILGYGGTATVPCSAYLLSTAPNIDPDSVLVNIQTAPTVSLNTLGGGALGRGLQSSVSASLSAVAPVGGVTFRLRSGNPGALLLAPNATTPGTDSIDVLVGAGFGSFTYVVQAQDTVTPGATLSVTVTDPSGRYAAANTLSVPIRQRAVQLSSWPSTMTTLQTTTPAFTAVVGVPTATNTSIAATQAVRTGGTPVEVIFATSEPDTAILLAPPSPGTEADTVRLLLQPGGSAFTPSSLAAGGAVVRARGAGRTTLTIATPGGATLTGTNTQSGTLTVSAPTLTTGGTGTTQTIARSLQRQVFTGLSTGVPEGGAVFRVVSSDSSRILIAPNPTTPGSGTLDIPVAQFSSSFSYVIQALDTVSTGVTVPVAVTETLGRYQPTSVTVAFRDRAVQLNSYPTTMTTLQTSLPAFTASLGVPNTGGSFLEANLGVRAGGPAVPVTLRTSQPATAILVGPPSPGVEADSVVLEFQPAGSAFTPSSVANGGVVVRPRAAGTTVLSVSTPGGRVLTGSQAQSATLTVSAPTIVPQFAAPTIARGLQRTLGVSLGASAPEGGAVIRMVSSDSSRILLAPDATTVGSGTLEVPLTQGQSFFNYTLQALDTASAGVTVPISVTETLGRYQPATVTATLRAYAVQILSAPTTQSTLQTTDNQFSATLGVVNASGTAVEQTLGVRAGGTPIPILFETTAPGVSTLVLPPSPGTTAASGTLFLQPSGSGTTPSNLAAGGVVVRPLSAGTTTLRVSTPGGIAVTSQAQTLTVSAPNVTLDAVTASGLGAGLQTQVFARFATAVPSARTLTLVSSDSSVLLLSSSATTQGSGTLTITVGSGAFAVGFFVQAIDAQRGNIAVTPSIEGYNSVPQSYNVVPPAATITNLPTSVLATAANQTFWVELGVPNAQQTSLADFQQRRGGAAPLSVTVTNSNSTAATLITAGTPGASGTFTIPAGQVRTSTTAATGFVADWLAPGSITWSLTVGSTDFLRIPAPAGTRTTLVQ